MRALIVTAVVLAAAVLVLILSTSGSSTAKTAGCIDVTIASTTGGANVHACGDQARQFCREQLGRNTSEARAVRTPCARLKP